TLQLGLQGLEHLKRPLLRQQAVAAGTLARIQPVEDLHQLINGNRGEGGGCCGEIALGKRLFDRVDQVGDLDGGDGDALRVHMRASWAGRRARTNTRTIDHRLGWTDRSRAPREQSESYGATRLGGVRTVRATITAHGVTTPLSASQRSCATARATHPSI